MSTIKLIIVFFSIIILNLNCKNVSKKNELKIHNKGFEITILHDSSYYITSNINKFILKIKKDFSKNYCYFQKIDYPIERKFNLKVNTLSKQINLNDNMFRLFYRGKWLFGCGCILDKIENLNGSICNYSHIDSATFNFYVCKRIEDIKNDVDSFNLKLRLFDKNRKDPLFSIYCSKKIIKW